MADTKALKTKVAKHVEVHNPVETRKLSVHATCILTGVIITIMMTYIPSDLLVHLAPLGVGIPQLVQEIVDRIIKGF